MRPLICSASQLLAMEPRAWDRRIQAGSGFVVSTDPRSPLGARAIDHNGNAAVGGFSEGGAAGGSGVSTVGGSGAGLGLGGRRPARGRQPRWTWPASA